MTVFVLTKIFGIDCVKSCVFNKESDARAELDENIRIISEDGNYEKIKTDSGEEYYNLLRSSKPENCISFVLKKCEVKI